MLGLVVEPLPAGCPWSGWAPPNLDWCEEELCAWIVNPAGAWSNLAYVAFGLVMWRAAAHARDPRLSLFGPASVLVGVCSFAYHASYTSFLQFFDFVGMFVFCFTVITRNALRLGWIRTSRQWVFFATGVGLFSAAVPALSRSSVPIQALVVVLILGILAQELAIRRRPRAVSTPYAPFVIALCLMTAAAIASIADLTRAWCDPGNHWLQGHAIWHLLSAAALYALFDFYRRLPGPASRARPTNG